MIDKQKLTVFLESSYLDASGSVVANMITTEKGVSIEKLCNLIGEIRETLLYLDSRQDYLENTVENIKRLINQND